MKTPLIIGLLLALSQLGYAGAIAEWDATGLTAGRPVKSVPSAIATGSPLSASGPADRAPSAVKVDETNFKGTALEFEAEKKQFLSAPAEGAYNFGANQPFTVEALLCPKSYSPSETTARQIVMKRGREQPYPGWSLCISDEGKLVFVMATASEPARVLKSSKPLPLDAWTHVAVCRTAKGKMQVYINGELDAQGFGLTDSLDSDAELFVGKHSGADNPGFYYDGLIGRIRISDEALDPYEFLKP